MQDVAADHVERDDTLRTRYEQLRAVVVGGDSSGWRHGLGVLANAGMVAWITAWAAAVPGPGAHGSPGATPQADASLPTATSPLPTAESEGGPELTCVLFPPAAVTQIVRVLTQLTLPHTRLPAHKQEVVPP